MNQTELLIQLVTLQKMLKDSIKSNMCAATHYEGDKVMYNRMYGTGIRTATEDFQFTLERLTKIAETLALDLNKGYLIEDVDLTGSDDPNKLLDLVSNY